MLLIISVIILILAKRLEAAGVKKASYIFVTGDLDVVEFTRKDGTKGQKNEIELHSWSYVNGGKGSEKSEGKKENTKKEFDEYYCNDEDDLP